MLHVLIKSHCQATTVMILYQSTESTYMPDFGLYNITPIPEVFGMIEIEELASFHPVQMHDIKNSPSSFLISLRNLPILFS